MIPIYAISAGGITADSTSLTQSGLPVRLRVDLRLNQVNTAEVVLGPLPDGAVAPGDPVEIELGYDGEGTEKVFTGVVEELQRLTYGYRIWCSSQMMALSQIYINKLYEQQKAGDIVSDLASIAEISTGEVQPGLDYPFYAVGSDRHLLAHLLGLAARDGFDVYADAEDKLVYAAYTGGGGGIGGASGLLGASGALRYGAELLAYHAEERPPRIDGVEVYGESPASLGEGDKAYSWLTKEEVKGNAGGSSGNIHRIAIPSIRNQDAAGSAAESIFHRLNPVRTGWVEALGKAPLALGGPVEIADLPDGGPNGSFKIEAIKHQLDKRHGFITKVHWKEV
ncbi:MAG: hypothetical protein AAF998_25800 [Bacteroidota bacterium]